MSRISGTLAALKQQGRKALIPYITAGDPQPAWTVELMHALVQSGADILELGVPFSDPMADGPVIQLACERALLHKVSLHQVLEMVRDFRRTDQKTPVVLMGYLNPIEMMGYQAFARQAAEVGVDGVLVVDLPPEEADDMAACFKSLNLDRVFLIAPTTTTERIKHVCKHSSGYVYYVSVRGVTGSASLVENEVAGRVAEIKAISDIPVGVGFGIKDAESAQRVSALADGVIVGSALVNLIAENQHDIGAAKQALGHLLGAMRAAMDAQA